MEEPGEQMRKVENKEWFKKIYLSKNPSFLVHQSNCSSSHGRSSNLKSRFDCTDWQKHCGSFPAFYISFFKVPFLNFFLDWKDSFSSMIFFLTLVTWLSWSTSVSQPTNKVVISDYSVLEKRKSYMVDPSYSDIALWLFLCNHQLREIPCCYRTEWRMGRSSSFDRIHTVKIYSNQWSRSSVIEKCG